MDLNPSNYTSQQQQQSAGTSLTGKQADSEKSLGTVEATVTANALADISAIISQQFTNYTDGGYDDGTALRDFTLGHPCWNYVHKSEDLNSAICRVCSQMIKPVDSEKAMEHFINCHPQIAAEFEQTWTVKMRPKTSVKSADEPIYFKEGSERRNGHGTEHPCWRYFIRNRKSADCRMCGTHVAYACSGNLMRHLRSRHVAESVITQKEWEEIQKRKKQLCELRMMATANNCASEEQSPSNIASYAYVDEEQDESTAGTGEEYDGTVENDEQRSRKESDDSSSNAGDVKLIDGGDIAVRNMHTFGISNIAPGTMPLMHHQGSWSAASGNRARCFTTERHVAFQKRVNSFASGLAEELASFPMQKSLLCMRRIRKFMDEQLLELDDVVQNSEDDIGIV